jgi:hypothetical protein
MPIPATTANAALSIVNGLVRLAGRVDRIMAEQTALRSDLAFAGKVIVKPPSGVKIKEALDDYVNDTRGQSPDPLGDRRRELETLLADSNTTRGQLMDWAETYVPDVIVYRVDDPSGDFAKKLAARRSTWDLDDQDIVRLAYYLDPDKDLREGKLAWQLAMSVVEVVADLAVENQQLIFRDDRARPVVKAVLERFADADLVNSGPKKIFLRVVLKATLNGALDAADSLDLDKAWVDAVVSALATAREKSAKGDDFVVGLVQGRGYNLLVSSLLAEGAEYIGGETASNFERVAADVLVAGAALVETRAGFDGFFADHWSDLLRAGLQSIHTNGDAILDDAQPILKDTLLAAVDVLATTNGKEFLSSDTLVNAVDAAIGAVAANPDLLGDKVWLNTLLSATVSVTSSQGIRKTFTDEGVQVLMQAVLGELASRPELLVAKPGLPQDVVGSILEALASSGKLQLEVIAASAVEGVLSGIAEKPELVGTDYPELVSEVAGALVVRLDDLHLSRAEAGEILGDVADAIANDTTLIGIDPTSLRGQVIDTVLGEVAKKRGKRMGGESIRNIVAALLRVAATNPDVLGSRPELLSAAIAPMLDTLAGQVGGQPVVDLRLDRVLRAGLTGVLDAIERDPAVLDSRYPQAAAVGVAVVKDLLDDGRLSDQQIEELTALVVETIAANVDLLVEEQEGLVGTVLAAVVPVLLADRPLRLDRDAVTAILREVTVILAAHGKSLLGGDPVGDLADRVEIVIQVGLDKAARELGRLLDRNAVAGTVVLLLRRWAIDEVPSLDINDPLFDRIFVELARLAADQQR